MKISELSNHLIYPSKYLKSNHLNKNINIKFKQILNFILNNNVFIFKTTHDGRSYVDAASV